MQEDTNRDDQHHKEVNVFSYKQSIIVCSILMQLQPPAGGECVQGGRGQPQPYLQASGSEQVLQPVTCKNTKCWKLQ